MDNQTLFTKLNQIKSLSEECLATLSKGPASKVKSAAPIKGKKDKSASDYILSIVNKIKNCDEADEIETKILDKTFLPGRILLPFYICYKYFPEQGLTTGDIEKITSELRVKIQTPNVSKTISNLLHKYLEGDSTRVKGKPVVYRINRKGAKYFESLLKLNEK
ncbi:MAG: hypothetical protein PHN95_02440 [Candidatus Pacebacteria bacterium]|jgi:hypothetical protein|nr:hypothetical protein [Candidatus Paceibacterota bacterium]